MGFQAGLVGAVLWSASGQVTVELVPAREQFVQGEALPVAVKIKNLSGQALRLGGEQDWLSFVVQSRDGVVVPQIGEIPVADAFVLPSAEVATKRVDLVPVFLISRAGRYNVTATLRIRGWQREVTSAAKGFDIIDGVTLWQQEFGVPNPSDVPPGAPPEVRRYILQQANLGRGQSRLYLRVTDASGAKSLRVYPIGGMISFSRPEHLIDAASDLHVLYQNAGHSFSYTKFRPNGQLILRQTYDYFGGWSKPAVQEEDGKLVTLAPQEGVTVRPRLKAEPDGTVHVIGGARRITPTDVPPPTPPPEPEAPQPLDSPTTPPRP